MKPNFLGTSLFSLVILAPSIVFELHNQNLLSGIVETILVIIASVCLFFLLTTVLLQIGASFEWLYSNQRALMSIRPIYLFYADKNNFDDNPSHKERVIHTLIGFFLYIILFTNFYQYLSWNEILQSTKSFNITNLTFVNSFYFTTVTSATVGYGDIFPCSAKARLLVSAQILTTFIYVIGIIASLPTLLSKINEKQE